MGEHFATSAGEICADLAGHEVCSDLPLPKYLVETYWWAYLHPKAVHIFERQWLVNLILWGNFVRLRDLALDEIGSTIQGDSLQVACVYGDFSNRFAERHAADAHLDIVDIAPVQLENACKKLGQRSNVSLLHRDSTDLKFEDNAYDQVVVFFLLHEQPEAVRIKTIQEALRVLRPGGKLVFVDYHKPGWKNPFRYLMIPILRTLEPFALDLWRNEIRDWLPGNLRPASISKETYFGGLYQKVVMTK